MAHVAVLVGLLLLSLLVAPVSGGGGPSGKARADRPSGTLVFVMRSSRLGAIDVASGRITRRRVPELAACGPELYVTGGRVVFGGVRGGRTVVYSAPISLDAAPERLGRAHAFVPSATEARVWLAGTDCSRSRMVGVREMAVGGRVTLASGRRVPGSWLHGAVPQGLVVQSGRRLVLWDPRAAGRGRRLPLQGVDDAHGSRLAGCRESRCGERVILDTATSREVLVRSRPPYRLDFGGDFSPDGSLLAAPAVAGRRWSVALVDTRNGSTTIVPGSRTGRAYPALSWSSSSGWLFFRGAGRRMMAYRPGAPGAVELPFRMPRRALSFTAG